MNESWLPRTDLESAFEPLEPNHAPRLRRYASEPAAEIAYCRHCGAQISAQRMAEYGACTRCSSGNGWESDDV